MGMKNYMKESVIVNSCGFKHLVTLLLVLSIQITGCVSENVEDEGVISSYQKEIVEKGPQKRDSDKGLGSLLPSPEPNIPRLDVTRKSIPTPDQSFRSGSYQHRSTVKNVIRLSIDDAVKRALVGSPEISIVSYDPSIAKEDIVKAVADFDPALFGKLNYDKQDDPSNSDFLADRLIRKYGKRA